MEWVVLRDLVLWLLSCFDVECGDQDGQANTCRFGKAINIRWTGMAQCQAKVPGQDLQGRRKKVGAFEAVMRRSVERVEGEHSYA